MEQLWLNLHEHYNCLLIIIGADECKSDFNILLLVKYLLHLFENKTTNE